jgi:hypothetical protein
MWPSRLFAALAAVVILATADVAAYIYGGMPLFATALAASVLAMCGWLLTTFQRPPSAPAALDLYLAMVVALMVLYSEQWYRGLSGSLVPPYGVAHSEGTGISSHAFVAVFPLVGSALLIAGALTYYYGTVFGRFAAWLAFAWGACDALAVYLYPLFARGSVGAMPGAFTAILPLGVSLWGIRTLVQREGAHVPRPSNVVTRGPGHHTTLSVALVALFVPTYAAVLYLQAGLMVVGIVAGSMVAGFVIWLRTTVRRPPAAEAILPAYLLTLFLFLVHVSEEYMCHFADRIAAAAHVRWTEAQFVEVIVLFGPAIWIAGAIGVYRRHPLGNFIAWFLFVGMMLGEPAHLLVFPFMEGGRYHYFPGMWSALAPMAPAAYGIWRMLADEKAAIRFAPSLA